MKNQKQQKELFKIKLVFDGWHCLSKRQTKEILKEARAVFVNANFMDNTGLLIENYDEVVVLKFCLRTLKQYKGTFNSWNGYEIKKISRKILFSYADRKRKLKFNYFKQLVRESKYTDIKLILAGTLYLEPKEVSDLLMSMEKDFEIPLYKMDDKALQDIYRLLLMYAASKERIFSLNK